MPYEYILANVLAENEGTVGVLCGPDLQLLLDADLDFQPGDIHPNAAGHAKIADALYQKVLAIPEPATGSLLAIGLIALSAGRRYGRHQRISAARVPRTIITV